MKPMAQQALEQFQKESGMHTSRSDSNNHLSVKNQDGKVIGHMYEDGSMKATNQNGAGALSWLMKK